MLLSKYVDFLAGEASEGAFTASLAVLRQNCKVEDVQGEGRPNDRSNSRRASPSSKLCRKFFSPSLDRILLRLPCEIGTVGIGSIKLDEKLISEVVS